MTATRVSVTTRWVLDPPFDADQFDKALAVTAPALSPSGLVYLEAPRQWTDEDGARHGLRLLRHLKAGAVHAHLLSAATP